MCRHLAYVGPPVSVASLVLEAPHALLRQSYAPVDMRGGGTMNADGFGAGWYPGAGADAARYRSAAPIWSDTSFPALAAGTHSGGVLAAVRSATVGMPVTQTAAAPFAEGRWLFSHNGVVRGWPHAVAQQAAALPVTDAITLDAPTDAALLWALVRHRLRAGADPADALGEVVTEVAEAAPASRLNLLLTDGAGIWATAWGHALSVHVDEHAALVASEPIDDGAATGRVWTEVPDGHLVVAGPGHCHLAALSSTPSTTMSSPAPHCA